MVKHKILTEDQIDSSNFLYESPIEDNIRKNLDISFAMLERGDKGLCNFINSILGMIGCYNIEGQDGGSVSALIGYIYLSPKEYWKPEYYGEMLVHETIHNALFLEDMVNNLYPDLDALVLDEAQVPSVIRQTNRPYDKSMHSACVAVGIMYYYHALGMPEKIAEYKKPLTKTVNSLLETDAKLLKSGINLMGDSGREINKQLGQFCKTWDFDLVRDVLKP